MPGGGAVVVLAAAEATIAEAGASATGSVTADVGALTAAFRSFISSCSTVSISGSAAAGTGTRCCTAAGTMMVGRCCGV